MEYIIDLSFSMILSDLERRDTEDYLLGLLCTCWYYLTNYS